ncbi:uncharacterized protein [Rutidosis leptorrhynchoides]|uniref:uncharacterized protein n=1 Tax=Rutidosis leptorrhynchoides TaxID=125765 RepID=UPI003A99AA3B
MSQIGQLMTLFMQESEETRRSTRTIVDILRDRTIMDGTERLGRRKNLQERLRLKNMVCCVSTWGLGPSTMSIQGDNDDENDENEAIDSIIHQRIDNNDVNLIPLITTNSDVQDCMIPPSPRMNLADALAAERVLRSTTEELMMENNDVNSTPSRISLMRLLEETDDQDDDETDMDQKGGSIPRKIPV